MLCGQKCTTFQGAVSRSFLHRTFRNLFIDGIKSLDEFRLYVEIRSSVTVELAREAIHGHSRSSFIVPIDAAYMTSY